MNLRNKILKQEIVYKARRFEVIRSEVEFPNGDEGIREFIKPHKAVAVVPWEMDKNGNCHVYLVEQYRDACDRVLIEIPAGVIDDGEKPQESAVRELMEEIGKKPKIIKEICTPLLSPGISGEIIYIYTATDFEDVSMEWDLHEFLNVVYYPLEKALKMIDKGIIVDGKTIVGLMMLEKKIK